MTHALVVAVAVLLGGLLNGRAHAQDLPNIGSLRSTDVGTTVAPMPTALPIVAAGNNQATAAVLTSDYNAVTIGSSVGGGVVLSFVAGHPVVVVSNQTGAVLLVYPMPGGQINAFGVNAAVMIAVGGGATFVMFSPLQWRAF